ncbi:MAG: AAA family ATPase [Lautropia sp.]|nr:AAA family ATPase [Lautropia sp.]
MYKSFFGLKSKPFRLNPHLRFLFNGEAMQRVVNTLKYGLYQREGLVLLTGAPGSGKSLLIQNISRRLPDAGIQVHTLATPRADDLSLLRQICTAFGLDGDNASADPGQLLDKIQHHLTAEARENHRLLLVIDEAHNLDDTALEAVRLLSNLMFNGVPLLQIFLVGQPALRARLMQPRLDALRQRILVTDHLENLSQEEVSPYILKRLQQAGWQGSIPFDAHAIERIHEATHGNPRRVNILCERLLTQAYVEDRKQVSAADVDLILTDMAAEWQDDASVSADAPPLDANGVQRLQALEKRLEALEASSSQISQVAKTILVRLDNIRSA